MPHYTQNFALRASKTLPRASAEDCATMPSKKMPSRKQAPEDLPVVQTLSKNIGALLSAWQSSAAPGEKRTQQDMADKAGIALRSLKNLLNGSHAPTLHTVHCISKGFDIEPWQLFIPNFPTEFALNRELQQKSRATIHGYFQNSEMRDVLESLQKYSAGSKH